MRVGFRLPILVDVVAIVVRLVGWPRTMSVNAKGSRRGNTYVCCSYGFHRVGGLVKRKKRAVVCRPLLCCILLCLLFGVGGDLLSHNLPVAVPSACAGLASGFGMGPGVSLLLLATDKLPGHFSGRGCCVRYCIVDAVTTVTVSCFCFCQHT